MSECSVKFLFILFYINVKLFGFKSGLGIKISYLFKQLKTMCSATDRRYKKLPVDELHPPDVLPNKRRCSRLV